MKCEAYDRLYPVNALRNAALEPLCLHNLCLGYWVLGSGHYAGVWGLIIGFQARLVFDLVYTAPRLDATVQVGYFREPSALADFGSSNLSPNEQSGPPTQSPNCAAQVLHDGMSECSQSMSWPVTVPNNP